MRRYPLFGFRSAIELWRYLDEHGGGISLSTCRNWVRGKTRPQSTELHAVAEALSLSDAERVRLLADLAPRHASDAT